MQKRILFFSVLITCLWINLVASAAQITDVRWGVDKNNILRFVIDCDKPTKYKIDTDDKTMLITIEADLANKVARQAVIKSDITNKLVLETKNEQTVLRIPLTKELKNNEYKGFTLRKDPVTKRPDRIVVDVTANKRQAVKTAANTVVATTAGAKKPATNKKATPSDYRTSGGIKNKKITLDAGHGGSDPGAVGGKGTREKDIALKITLKVRDLLEKRGAKISMTRTTDQDVYGLNATDAQELQARVDVAENNNADLFVSLHINSSVKKNVGGFSSYYYPKTTQDARIASCVQKQITKNFGLDDLGIRQANFYVNKRSSMPSALIEMAFISNPKEERLLNSNWFQTKLAKAIAEGIEDYFQ